MKKDWQTKTLGDVCHVYQPETISLKQMEPGPYPVYGANGKIGSHNQFNHEARQLILGCRGSCGTVHFTAPRAWINGNAMVVQAKEGVIDADFLAYALRGGIDIADAITGTAQPQITRASLMPIRISYPESLTEQQRIVGVLDEAMAGIATARAHAETNLQNARALFESHLHAVFTQRGPGWVEKTLEEAADPDCSLSYGIVQPGDDVSGGLPVVRPTDLTSKLIELDGLKRIDPKLASGYQRTQLQGGELLLCVRGSTGTISVAATTLKGANVTRGIVPIRFKKGLLAPEFGYYLMKSAAVQDQIRAKTYGAALMQINIRDLRNLSLSFPPLAEQQPMAAQLDALSAETQCLAALYERKLAALEELKKSLLHQAFAGEL
jgi:type I restriction enzyme S subunit